MPIPFCSLAISVSTLGFYLSYAISAALYPGGTWEDTSTVGYSFWQNYLCDVLQDTGLNGLPHLGSHYGLMAFGFLLATLLFWWTLLAKFLDEYSPTLARVVLMASFFSAVGFAGTVAFPAEEALRGYHFVAVLVAVLCGLFAIIMPLVYFLKMPTYRSLGKTGLLLISPVVITLCYYIAYHLEMIVPREGLVIGLQKVSLITASMLCLLSARKQAQIAAARNA